MTETRPRWAALDALRGFAVFLMIPVNAAMGFDSIPAFFKHSPGRGVTLADFIMPAFLFALGLSSSLSLRKRLAAEGWAKTWVHAFFRYGLIFVFGTIGFFLVWKEQSWEILQMLGLVGILAFPFLFLAPVWRVIAALLLLGVVEILRPDFFDPAFQLWYDSGIGGPLGAIPLAVIPIVASVFGEALHERPPAWRGLTAALAGAAILGAGLAFSRWIEPNKHFLTLSYLLITTGVAALALAVLEGVAALAGGKRRPGVGGGEDLPLLGALGRNPLAAYMASGILILGLHAWLPSGLAAGLAWLASLAVLALITAAAFLLDRKRIYIKL